MPDETYYEDNLADSRQRIIKRQRADLLEARQVAHWCADALAQCLIYGDTLPDWLVAKAGGAMAAFKAEFPNAVFPGGDAWTERPARLANEGAPSVHAGRAQREAAGPLTLEEPQ